MDSNGSPKPVTEARVVVIVLQILAVVVAVCNIAALPAFLTLFVPRFRETYSDFNVKLPAHTQWIIALGDQMAPWGVVGAALGALALAAVVLLIARLAWGRPWILFVLFILSFAGMPLVVVAARAPLEAMITQLRSK